MTMQHLVPFQDHEILSVETPDGVFVPLRPICTRLGLDWKSQHGKLRSAPERWGVVMIATPSAGGEQVSVCIPLNRLAWFLATINPRKVHADLRETVERYQQECADVLDRHFRKLEADRDERLAELEAQVATLQQFILAEKPLWSKISRYRSLGYNPALIADLIGRSYPQVNRIVTMLEGNGVLAPAQTTRAFDETLQEWSQSPTETLARLPVGDDASTTSGEHGDG